MEDKLQLNLKFNSDEDQVHIVDNDTDVTSFIRSIIKTGLQEEAFYVLDVRDVIKKYEIWKEKFPRVVPYYVKCNDNLFLLKILSSLGIGFDCASKEEIRKIISLGVDASRIIFANTVKLPSHLKYAAYQGIELTTFDNETELYKIKQQLPMAKLLLRFKCDAAESLIPLGNKFGCDCETEAPTLLRLARTLQLEIVGICFHVGSGCSEPAAFRRAIIKAHSLFELGKSIGFDMHVLDIGGGFPGNKGASIDETANIVNGALEEYFPIDRNVQIIAEPGRYFSSSAFTLAAFVFSKRIIVDFASGLTNNIYYINDGVCGSFNSVFYNKKPIVPIPLSETKSRQVKLSSLWGPTSSSKDCILENFLFPDVNVGEWLIFENMGDYTTSISCPFNGYPIPRVFSILTDSIL